jgi:hypothetical protein
MDWSTCIATVLGVAVRVGVGRGRLVAGDVSVGVGILLGVDIVASVDVAGLGNEAGLVRAGVAVDVQPAATARADTAPATTNAAGFTQPL